MKNLAVLAKNEPAPTGRHALLRIDPKVLHGPSRFKDIVAYEWDVSLY
jgi:hypothetical protein